MKLLTHLPPWLKNKFFISTVAFIAWICFFDERDVFTMNKYRHELDGLQKSKRYYTEQIAKEKTELENLRYNPAALEKYAREKYYMKRDGEDLFLVPEKQSN